MNWDMDEAVGHYRAMGAPGDQSVLVALLREMQQAYGGALPETQLPLLAQKLDTPVSILRALIRRIPDLKMAEGHILELCGGPNCSKRAKLEAYVRTHLPDNTSLKLVPCMRLCGKGPNLRFDGTLYHGADEALLRKLLDSVTERRS